MLTSGEPEWKVWEKLYKIFSLSFKISNYKLSKIMGRKAWQLESIIYEYNTRSLFES